MKGALLARGPWQPAEVECRWREEVYEPEPRLIEAADEAIGALRERGSPAHDGLAARLAGYEESSAGRLVVELQPARWALRLVHDPEPAMLASLCVVRDTAGRWLAGRRAGWVATWAGRWALGAGGAVDLGETPVDTLWRELREEWSVEPERLSVAALGRVPTGLVLLIGLATLPEGAEPVPDAEHDEMAWWPPQVADWPAEADEPLRAMANLLSELD